MVWGLCSLLLRRTPSRLYDHWPRSADVMSTSLSCSLHPATTTAVTTINHASEFGRVLFCSFILAKRYYPFQKVNCIIYSKYQCKWQRWPTTIVDYTSSDQYWLLILYLCYVILAAVRCCRAAACCPFLEPLTNTLSNFLEAMACSRHNQFNRCSSLQLQNLLLWNSNGHSGVGCFV